MADHIYIKCLDEMSGYGPYKVYGEDDWMTVMWNNMPHDLNIWWDDLKNQWGWGLYRFQLVSKRGGGFLGRDERDALASGDAVVLEDYEGH